MTPCDVILWGGGTVTCLGHGNSSINVLSCPRPLGCCLLIVKMSSVLQSPALGTKKYSCDGHPIRTQPLSKSELWQPSDSVSGKEGKGKEHEERQRKKGIPQLQVASTGTKSHFLFHQARERFIELWLRQHSYKGEVRGGEVTPASTALVEGLTVRRLLGLFHLYDYSTHTANLCRPRGPASFLHTGFSYRPSI